MAAEQAAKSKQKKVRALHQKAKVFRDADPVVSVFMWGVNFMMSELEHAPETPLLMPTDFKASSKVSVQNTNYNNLVLPSKYKVKEYCPLVFRDLRERFKEDPDDFLSSLVEGPFTSQATAGRSHATFLFTHDRRLVLKSVSSEDVATFHSMFPSYHAYVVEHHGKSFLPQYLGMYRVTVEEKETYFVVMRNVFPTAWPIHRVYDIKGSTVDRSASEKELAKEQPVLKDNDFRDRGERIQLGPQRATVLETLKRDAEYLAAQKVMDYSLLVGIHDCSPDREVVIDADTDVYAAGDPSHKQLYVLGVIDVLTKYGAKKKAAHTAKGMKHPGGEISTVNPEQYLKRFLETLTAIIVE